jgi:hypothetical protein
VLENDILEGELYEMSLAATSLFGKGVGSKMPLNQYVRFLASHNVDVTAVVTEMRFDTDSATPKLTFCPVRHLDIDELEAVRIHGESPEARLAITPVFTSTPSASPEEKEELVFLQPTKAKEKATAAEPVKEPVVRKSTKTAAPPPPAPVDMESLLAEWAD